MNSTELNAAIKDVKHAVSRGNFERAAKICNSVDATTRLAIYRELPVHVCRSIYEMPVVATKELRRDLFNKLCK